MFVGAILNLSVADLKQFERISLTVHNIKVEGTPYIVSVI
jgi:hypothetical protein